MTVSQVIYTGAQTSNVIAGDDTTYGQAKTKKDEFEAQLIDGNFGVIDFEDDSLSGTLSNGVDYLITGAGASIVGSPNAGTFPTSGSKFLFFETNGPDDTVTISFPNGAVEAFGFYATDIEVTTLTVHLTSGDTETFAISSPLTAFTNVESILFFGLIDAGDPITSIDFEFNSFFDFIGFDDIIIGTANDLCCPASSQGGRRLRYGGGGPLNSCPGVQC